MYNESIKAVNDVYKEEDDIIYLKVLKKLKKLKIKNKNF